MLFPSNNNDDENESKEKTSIVNKERDAQLHGFDSAEIHTCKANI
jgi:hypothetical protein